MKIPKTIVFFGVLKQTGYLLRMPFTHKSTNNILILKKKVSQDKFLSQKFSLQTECD